MGYVTVALLSFTRKNMQRSHKGMSTDFSPFPVIFCVLLGPDTYRTFETRMNNNVYGDLSLEDLPSDELSASIKLKTRIWLTPDFPNSVLAGLSSVSFF